MFFLTKHPNLKGSIAYLYNQINLLRLGPLNSIKSLWEEDMGMAILEDVWIEILKRIHSV